MPVRVGAQTMWMEQRVFGRIAYDVMGCVFEIHREFGRFFDQQIYQRELGRRYPGTQLEVPLEVTFESFHRRYSLDALVDGGAVFALKTVESLTDRHRAMFMHHLLLAELPHGKLVNLRTEQVQSEFVNTTLRLGDRTGFEVADHGWQERGDQPIREWYIAFLRDVGASLDVSLYEEALTHLLGGDEKVLQEVEIISSGQILGLQKFHLVTPRVAFKVTTLKPPTFEAHARRLLEHTNLEAIQWINVTRNEVSFQTIRK